MSNKLAFALVLASVGWTPVALSQPYPPPQQSTTAPPTNPAPEAPAPTMPMGHPHEMGQGHGMGPAHEMQPGMSGHHMDMGQHMNMPPPKHWTRSEADWKRHVEMCQKRYKSYDPKTDRYNIRHGVSRHCTL